jgi:hypothetical protein
VGRETLTMLPSTLPRKREILIAARIIHLRGASSSGDEAGAGGEDSGAGCAMIVSFLRMS